MHSTTLKNLPHHTTLIRNWCKTHVLEVLPYLSGPQITCRLNTVDHHCTNKHRRTSAVLPQIELSTFLKTFVSDVMCASSVFHSGQEWASSKWNPGLLIWNNTNDQQCPLLFAWHHGSISEKPVESLGRAFKQSLGDFYWTCWPLEN